jgi:hypothetical protein
VKRGPLDHRTRDAVEPSLTWVGVQPSNQADQ